MSEQLYKSGSGHEDIESEELDVSGQERREKVVSDTDALLDDIDSALEENAQEFVDLFKQKNGQ